MGFHYQRNLLFHLAVNSFLLITGITVFYLTKVAVPKVVYTLLALLFICIYIALFFVGSLPKKENLKKSAKIIESVERLDLSEQVISTTHNLDWYNFIKEMYRISIVTLLATLLFIVYEGFSYILLFLLIYLFIKGIRFNIHLHRQTLTEQFPKLSSSNRELLKQIYKAEKMRPISINFSETRFKTQINIIFPSTVILREKYITCEHFRPISKFPLAHEVGHTQTINPLKFYSFIFLTSSLPFVGVFIASNQLSFSPIVGGLLFGFLYLGKQLITRYFYRINEYKADLFASRYTTPRERVHSLLYFSEGHTEPPTGILKKLMTLFSSHPPIDERIERLSKEMD